MTNLTAREKGFLYVITLLIIVVLGYFFGIRNLNIKYAEYQEELKTLQDRKEYLDKLIDPITKEDYDDSICIKYENNNAIFCK